jgi:agmatinase
MVTYTRAVPKDLSTFSGFQRCTRLEDLIADVAIIGIPYLSPYEVDEPENPNAVPVTGTVIETPTSIRRYSRKYIPGSYDFDFNGDPISGNKIRIMDCGDVILNPETQENNLEIITNVIKIILDRGAVPIIMGGDHGTPIPVLKAYEKHSPICIVHVDAHLDFRDERYGVKHGLSSPIRRASELPWVESIFQVGLRGVGSAGMQEVEDARKWGCIIITAEELHREGVNRVLKQLPKADRYYITVDVDGFDPSIAPGVNHPVPGGLSYYEALNLFRGVAKKGTIVGFDLVEIVPSLDFRKITCILGARLIMNLICIMADSNQFTPIN